MTAAAMKPGGATLLIKSDPLMTVPTLENSAVIVKAGTCSEESTGRVRSEEVQAERNHLLG